MRWDKAGETCRLAAGLTLASWWGRECMAGLSFSSWSSTKCRREVLRSVPFTSASFNSVSSLNPAAHKQMLNNNNNNNDNV